MKNTTTVRIKDNNELVGFLRTTGGQSSCFISLRTVTPVKMRKTGNPFVGAVKVSRRNGLINVDFVSSVERNMKAAGIENPEYTAGSTWYVHETTEEGKKLALCVHKNDVTKHYLQYFPLKNLSTHYELNGRRLTAEEVTKMKTFITEDTRNEFKPIVITLAMDSIKEIKLRQVTILTENIERIKSRLTALKNTEVSLTAPTTTELVTA